MLRLAQNYHAKQSRNNSRIPYWYHCLSVAEIVFNALEQSQEIKNNKLLSTIICGAIGHDLFEDTTVEKKLISKQFGKEVEKLILYLTNEEDDAHRKEYMKKIKNSPEEALLIKYADLIENTISCAYGIHDLGVDWIKNFYIPIKNDTQKILALRKFVLYPKTATLLREQFAFAEERLISNINKH